MRYDLTKLQIEAVAAMLHDALEDDERFYLDTLEGETDLYEWVRRLLGRIEEDEGVEAALIAQIASRTVRKSRAEARIKVSREAIQALLQCAKLGKLSLPEATVSVRTIAASIKVNDPSAVPEIYTIPNPKPDLDKIKAAFSVEDEALPNWLRIEPEKPSLTIRRK